jgi:hypothetical protein
MIKLVTKTLISVLSLLYWNIAISGGTIQKCVDAKGAVTFSERCAANQQASDTGLEIDSRSEKQKAEDAANNKKYLEDLEQQSKLIPTATTVPVAQPTATNAEVIPSETTDYDDDYDYGHECLSSARNCVGNNVSNLTPAQKAAIINRKASQLPARSKRR